VRGDKTEKRQKREKKEKALPGGSAFLLSNRVIPT
jgi:hypothetical protein